MAYPNRCGLSPGVALGLYGRGFYGRGFYGRGLYGPGFYGTGLYGPRYYGGGARLYRRNVLPNIQSKEPIETTCPNCKLEVVTETERSIAEQSAGCFILSMFACFCCCFPDKWKSVVHNCPNCKTSIGMWRWRFC
jgi:hypothetical protein